MFDAANNETTSEGNQLLKVQPFINIILSKFQTIIFPQEDVCIDKTIISFRGRLSFQQYEPKRDINCFKAFQTLPY